jgi:hypothetical protein
MSWEVDCVYDTYQSVRFKVLETHTGRFDSVKAVLGGTTGMVQRRAHARIPGMLSPFFWWC